jgi:hypothetical protein
MNNEAWRDALAEGAFTGGVAGLVSAAVLAVAGWRETGRPAAAINAESHWLWGDEALRQDRPSWRYTFTGLVTHHLATVFWATLQARVRGRALVTRRLSQDAAAGAATAATAALVDYNLVPRRLRPGFEGRLSRGATTAVFAGIAVGLMIGSVLLDRAQRRP